jgi:predicted small integral membrane protein
MNTNNKENEKMKTKIALIIAVLLIAISMIYTTYATFTSMTEDVRHTLEMFTEAPDSVKQGFNIGNWDFDTLANSIIETTTTRNQMSMTFLIIIEAILAVVAIIAIVISKE